MLTFTLVLVLLSLPDPLLHPLVNRAQPPSVAWLDASWIYGQALAASQGIHWGSGLQWTHGPYGYLGSPVLVDAGHWLASVAVSVAVRLAFVGSVVLLLVRDRSPRWTWVFAGLVLVLPSSNLSLDIEAVVTATLLLMAALGEGPSARVLSFAAGVLVGLAFLVKGTALGSGIALLIVLGGICALRRDVVTVSACSVAALLTAGVLWWVGGQSVTDLGLFVRGTIELAAGYPSAMGRLGRLPGAALPVLAAGGGMIIGGTAFAVWGAARRGYRQTAERLALGVVVVYVQYRNTMVRPTLGSLVPLAGVILLMGLPLLGRLRWRDALGPAESGATVSRVRFAMPSLLVLLSVAELVIVPQPSILFLADRARGYAHAVDLIASPASREQERETTANAVRHSYRLAAAAVDGVRGGSTDVVPWDTGLVAGYGLKWNPRPVLQSYSAYTAWLDRRDAAFFESSSAPASVIYVNESIDGRYPIADEPAALQAMLNWYRPVAWSGQYLALRRNRSPGRAAIGSADVRCGTVGSWIEVPPTPPGEDRVGSVDLGMSAPGAIMAALLEPPETQFQLRGPWGQTAEMRLVRGSAGDGILLTGYASDAAAIADLWNGVVDKPITALRVSSRGAYAYSSTACVRFTRAQIVRH